MTQNRLDGRTLAERLTIPSEGYNYESPVALIERKAVMELNTQIENEITATIKRELDIEVNKEELLKALQYDRGQYDKGFADGQRAAQKTGEWETTDAYPHNVYCSVCHTRYAQTHWQVWEDKSLPRNYCPNCGAKMSENPTSSESEDKG